LSVCAFGREATVVLGQNPSPIALPSGRWASREDSAFFGTGSVDQRRRGFEKATAQAGHLFDELLSDRIGIRHARQVCPCGERA